MPNANAPTSPSLLDLALLDLRARAEKRQRLAGKPAITRTPAETEWLLQELQVHQIELEIQNEELHLARTEAEMARAGAETLHAQYMDLYENAPVAYVTLDSKGTMHYLNRRASHLFETPTSRLTGRRFLLFVAPPSREAFLDFLQLCLHNPTPQVAELSLLTEQGREMQVRLEGTAGFDPQGRSTVRLALVDITAPKQEEALRTERARRLNEASPATTFIITPEGTVDYLSPQWYQYTGLPPGSSTGTPWPSLLHPDDEEAIMQSFTEVLATGQSWRFAHRLRHHSGEYRWFLSRGAPELDAEGRPLRWYGANLDIHEQWELQQRLLAENELLAHTMTALDHFVYTAAHDLKEPLNNLVGLFEELRHTATFHDPEAPLLFDLFGRDLRNMHDTLDDLTLAVRTSGNAVKTASIAMAPLADEVLLGLQPQIAALGALVTVNFEDLPTLPVPRAMLRSVMYNLLTNALKYAAPSRIPRITLTSSAEAGEAVLTVQDNGLGIDLEHCGSQLFGRFQRFHDHVSGTGLGLYLVQRLVQESGGRIEVESAVNEGTTFRLRFPASSKVGNREINEEPK